MQVVTQNYQVLLPPLKHRCWNTSRLPIST